MNPVGDRQLVPDDQRGSVVEYPGARPDVAVAHPSAKSQSALAAARVERSLAIATLVAIPLIVPLWNIRWGASWAPFVLLGAGALLCWILFGWVVGPLSASLARLGNTIPLKATLGVGVAVQLLVAVLTAPVPESDFGYYARLAQQIASGLPYLDDMGRRAMLPPGLPFTLAPFVAIFGPTLTATAVANVALYLGGAYAIWSVTRNLFGAHAAGIAALLFTIWPARVLMAGLAAKENLLIALVVAGTGLCFKALDPATRRPLLIALFTGVALGLAALTQPAVLILLFVLPVAYRFAIVALGRRRFITRIAVIVVGAAIAIAPWMARNCIVFEGEFCGISTNGGPVFWRANNPNSTGVFMTGGRDSPLQGLSEVERNRHGYELGRQWILAHPLDAAKLTVRKEFAYLGGDDYGAYWSVLRGAGGNEGVAMRDASEGRIVLYRLASALSLAYWVLLAALCAQAIWRWPSTDSHQGRVLAPLISPLLCGAVVFGIFESGDRQHMFAVGPLIVLAAAGIAQRHSAPDAAASGAPHR